MQEPPVDLEQLLSCLPHQPPMRLLERLDAVEPGRSAIARRTVRPGDWYLEGHFPGDPIVPAVVLIELVAQAGGVAAASGADAGGALRMRLAGVHTFKFPAAARPGTDLVVTTRVAGRMGALVRIDGEVTAGGDVVATGSVTLAAMD